MLKLNIEMTGLNDTIKELKGLPGDVVDEVKDATREDLRDVASILGDYPAQLPGTRYRRTGDLGFGWLEAKTELRFLDGLDFEMSLSNPVEYAGDVQGSKNDPRQQLAEFKKRNWKTTDQALEETEQRAQDRLEKAVQKSLDKFGRP